MSRKPKGVISTKIIKDVQTISVTNIGAAYTEYSVKYYAENGNTRGIKSLTEFGIRMRAGKNCYAGRYCFTGNF